MRAVWLVVLALVVTPGAATAQVRGPDRERRERLEQQVRHRFMNMIAERLDLDEEQRERIRTVLGESSQARLDLALESQALRIDLMQAVRDEEASMDRFREILEGLDRVRAREQAIQEREEEALAEVLDPRQQAIFLFMRMQMNERIREMRGNRPGPGGPGGPSVDLSF